MKSIFYQPGIFLAEGIKTQDWTPESIVNQIADSGFKWVAQQVGLNADGKTSNEPDMVLITSMRDICHSRGIRWGIWEWEPTTLFNVNKFDPNFWILNVEQPGGYWNLLRQFRHIRPLLPAGVITNCALDPRPFIEYNIKVIPEAYQNDNPQATPQNMVNRCHEMGWKVVFPALGCYHDYPLSNYQRAGNGYSVYLGEGMHPEDWDTAKEWNS